VALCHSAVLFLSHSTAEAGVSKSDTQQQQGGQADQGGKTAASTQFRQQLSIGGGTQNIVIRTSRFRIVPGFFGAVSETGTLPVSDLDLLVLYAKTDPLGTTIDARTWQQDADPIFIWEPPATGAEVAGYSYALDGSPDDTVDTSGTSFNVAAATPATLTDGTHTFSVKAINTAGNAGKPASFELWVDTTPPQLSAYSPAAAALLRAPPTVTASVSDASSGVDAQRLDVFINGSAASVTFDAGAGTLTATGGTWREGSNNLELRASDAVGNVLAPLIWSVTLDTLPPTGTVIINNDATITTSVYVTLRLSAVDATSGLDRVLIANQEFAGYVEEPYVALREFWKLTPVRGPQTVYVKFMDQAGNVSAPVADEIDLALLAPETVITSGPAGFTQNRTGTFTFMCPEADCVFASAFDTEAWSEWSPTVTATSTALPFGNHYFRVKAARDVNGVPGIQPDEEDPSPAERTWVIGFEPSLFNVPKGPAIKVWRLE
jgi:hypothetical protein